MGKGRAWQRKEESVCRNLQPALSKLHRVRRKCEEGKNSDRKEGRATRRKAENFFRMTLKGRKNHHKRNWEEKGERGRRKQPAGSQREEILNLLHETKKNRNPPSRMTENQGRGNREGVEEGYYSLTIRKSQTQRSTSVRKVKEGDYLRKGKRRRSLRKRNSTGETVTPGEPWGTFEKTYS